MELYQDFKELLALVNVHQVEYIMGGSHALASSKETAHSWYNPGQRFVYGKRPKLQLGPKPMRIATFMVACLILLGGIVDSFADGKFFWRETIPPEIPYQRALLLFSDGRETLLLQSKYQLDNATTTTFLGWVVPIPGVPDLASIPADSARSLFRRLARASSPKVTRLKSVLLEGALLGLSGLSILTLLVCLFSLFLPLPRWVKAHRRRLVRYSVYTLLICFLIGAGVPNYLSFGLPEAVDVIKAEQVGIYDVRVVKSDDPAALIEWLNQNQFQFDDSDNEVFENYIKQEWSFIVANVNLSGDEERWEIVSEGLVAPLILRFQADTPIYPLALTSTAGGNTEVLIYLLSHSKMECDDRLKLRYAGEAYEGMLYLLEWEDLELQGFFSEKDLSLPYLCKFKSVLTPSQMRKDLTFTQARVNEPYREHIIEW